MRHLSTDFTFDTTSYPRCRIWEAPENKTIYIHFADEDGYPRSSFFLHDEQALVNFKNEILQAFESFMRKKKCTLIQNG